MFNILLYNTTTHFKSFSYHKIIQGRNYNNVHFVDEKKKEE